MLRLTDAFLVQFLIIFSIIFCDGDVEFLHVKNLFLTESQKFFHHQLKISRIKNQKAGLRLKISFLLTLRLFCFSLLFQVALECVTKTNGIFSFCDLHIFRKKTREKRLWNVNENASAEAVDGEKQTL